MRHAPSSAACLTVALVACGGGPRDATPRLPAPPPPALTSRYLVTTRLDLSAATLLPDALNAHLTLLRAFERSPGEAMFLLAEQRGVPAAKLLRAALPGALERKLTGWIDRRVATTAAPGVVHTVVGAAEHPLGELVLESALTLAPADHALVTVGVETAGHRVDVQAATLQVDANLVVVRAQPAISGDGAALVVGPHTFGVAFGQVAWDALDGSLTARLGAPPAQALATALGCAELAAAIANECVLGACVGHEAELREVCDGAAAEVVDRLRAEVLALDLDVVDLRAGRARGVDADGDGVAERLDGAWDASVELVGSARVTPATLTATSADAAGT